MFVPQSNHHASLPTTTPRETCSEAPAQPPQNPSATRLTQSADGFGIQAQTLVVAGMPFSRLQIYFLLSIPLMLIAVYGYSS